jgi:hypothetical protein
MPTAPQPPKKGHPGQPPSRDEDADARKAPASAPRNYGQSAPMPGAGEPPIEGETRAPARKITRVEQQHESVEDLAGEPMRESGEDEEPGGTASDTHGNVSGANDELEALGDMPPGTEEGGPLRDKVEDPDS